MNATNFRSGWFTLIHHTGPVIEWSGDIEERISFIETQKDPAERELRLSLIQRVPDEWVPKRIHKARAEWDKARAEWYKAIAEWDKAIAERGKARAEWYKAIAEWYKARAERGKARAEWDKAIAEWDKAIAEWDKARAEWYKAIAEWDKEKTYALVKPAGCPWDGLTIFSKGASARSLLDAMK